MIEGLSYEQITSFTHQPVILFILVLTMALPTILFTLTAVLSHARSSNGTKLSRRMIQSINVLYVYLYFTIVQNLLILFGLIFPYWANLI